ncbi:MAG: hypothetical protein AAB427_16755, partial [Chloroflexota bacterium]
GVSRAYCGKVEHPVDDDPRLAQIVFYLVPLWGVLHRSAQAPTEFLGLPIRFVPVHEFVAIAGGVAALTAFAWFVATRVQAWRDEIEAFCLKRGLHYVPISTETRWDQVVLYQMRRMGLVK